MFDDLEDGDATGSVPQATNLATGLLFAAQLALGELAPRGILRERLQEIWQGLNHACLKACSGQHADLAWHIGAEPPEPDDWFAMARNKSGELLGWACWVGAVVAQADETTRNGLREYGVHLGILLQVADDFKDLWSPGSQGDIKRGRMTLPIVYALFVAGRTNRQALARWLLNASHGDPAAENRARERITSLGAQKYILAAAWLERQEAISALNCIKPFSAAGNELITLGDQVFPALGLVGKQDHGS
jgi:geranylgeranyl pyrophosphate synthase